MGTMLLWGFLLDLGGKSSNKPFDIVARFLVIWFKKQIPFFLGVGTWEMICSLETSADGIS
jgi:hypothetical protein